MGVGSADDWVLVSNRSGCVSRGGVEETPVTRCARGAVMRRDQSSSASAIASPIGMAMPPWRAGTDSSFRSGDSGPSRRPQSSGSRSLQTTWSNSLNSTALFSHLITRMA